MDGSLAIPKAFGMVVTLAMCILRPIKIGMSYSEGLPAGATAQAATGALD
jgi:hypothetical protein